MEGLVSSLLLEEGRGGRGTIGPLLFTSVEKKVSISVPKRPILTTQPHLGCRFFFFLPLVLLRYHKSTYTAWESITLASFLHNIGTMGSPGRSRSHQEEGRRVPRENEKRGRERVSTRALRLSS